MTLTLFRFGSGSGLTFINALSLPPKFNPEVSEIRVILNEIMKLHYSTSNNRLQVSNILVEPKLINLKLANFRFDNE